MSLCVHIVLETLLVQLFNNFQCHTQIRYSKRRNYSRRGGWFVWEVQNCAGSVYTERLCFATYND